MAAKQDRIAIAAEVSRLLAHPEAGGIFPARDHLGKRQILIALSTDTYGELVQRLKAFKGPVNVAIGVKGAIEVVTLHRSAESASAGDVDTCEVGEESELGLLIALLRRTRRMTRVRLARPKYDAELVDRESQTFADA